MGSEMCIRDSLVMPKTFGTTDVQADWVTYPEGGDAPAHYHTDSRHYFFIIAGSGTFVGGEDRQPIAKGDVIMCDADEMHAFTSDPGVSLEFIELWVPGTHETIWADGEDTCRWTPQQ